MNRMKANVQKQLLEELYSASEGRLSRLLGESDDAVEIRERCVESMDLLKQALVRANEQLHSQTLLGCRN